MNDFCKEVRKAVGGGVGEKSINILVPTSNTPIIPVISFRQSGEVKEMFWINSISNYTRCCDNYGKSHRFKTHRPNINVERYGSLATNIIPFRVRNAGPGDIELGKDLVQDKLWFELIDFIRPC